MQIGEWSFSGGTQVGTNEFPQNPEAKKFGVVLT